MILSKMALTNVDWIQTTKNATIQLPITSHVFLAGGQQFAPRYKNILRSPKHLI